MCMISYYILFPSIDVVQEQTIFLILLEKSSKFASDLHGVLTKVSRTVAKYPSVYDVLFSNSNSIGFVERILNSK